MRELGSALLLQLSVTLVYQAPLVITKKRNKRALTKTVAFGSIPNRVKLKTKKFGITSFPA